MKTLNKKEMMVFVFILFFGLAGFSSVSAQEGKYTLVEIGTPGGPFIYNLDINDSGQVVGTGDVADDARPIQAFFWAKSCAGQTDCFGFFFGADPDANLSSANSISKNGVVSGSKNGRAFMVGGDTTFTDLGVLPSTASSSGFGINSTKKVAGSSWSEGVAELGALWENNAPTNLPGFGGSFTRAVGINDQDQITGHSAYSSGAARAFRWHKGAAALEDLGTLPDFSDSYAARINIKGEVVGYSSRTIDYNLYSRACLWRNGSIVELKAKGQNDDLQSLEFSEAYGMNDYSVAVGTYWGNSGLSAAFIWDEQNGIRDLNSLIPTGSGWFLKAAFSINNNGEIVGYGYKNGSTKATAFLLIPPPLPQPPDDPADPLKVKIDIRPWNTHNNINRQAWWGLVPVAILSTRDFDAVKKVDQRSLTFGPKGNETHAAFCTNWKWDVNHDRRKDLICYFHERPANFQCGDTTGILKGKTKGVNGVEFSGEDTVTVVPCLPPKKHHKGR